VQSLIMVNVKLGLLRILFHHFGMKNLLSDHRILALMVLKFVCLIGIVLELMTFLEELNF